MANVEELKALFPNLSDSELTVAAENLDRYLLLAWEIVEDQRMRDRALLADSAQASTIEAKVDSHTN